MYASHAFRTCGTYRSSTTRSTTSPAEQELRDEQRVIEVQLRRAHVTPGMLAHRLWMRSTNGAGQRPMNNMNVSISTPVARSRYVISCRSPQRVELPEERHRHHAQDVHRRERRREHAERRRPRIRLERADEDVELRDEARRARAARATRARRRRRRTRTAACVDEATEEPHIARVGLVVDRADHGEEDGRHDAVREHLQHGAVSCRSRSSSPGP